jgi:hypothetical protein
MSAVCAVGRLSCRGCVAWAWVWGAVGTCWHCDRHWWWVLVWAFCGWKRWGRLGHVLCPRIGGSSCHGLLSVVCGGLWGRSWCPCHWGVGWGGHHCCGLGICDVGAWGGSVGAWWGHVNNALCGSPSCGVSPVVCSPPVAPCMPHIPRVRGKGCGDGGVLFVVFEAC